MRTLFFFVLIPMLGYAQTPEKELSPQQVLKLVPDAIDGFYQNEDSRSTSMKVGTLTYSMCEKNFARSNKTIKILLFDFKNAPIMYSQAMRKWNNADPVESDSLILRAVSMDNCSGWEWYSKQSRTSQIFLGICDRFFLNMTGENVDLEVLKSVVKDFPLEKFPK